MDRSLNGYFKQANVVLESVMYKGTDAVAEGEAFCYAIGSGVATANDGRRQNYVERPSTTNNRAFAGVALRSYPASSSGSLIEIAVPGSRGVKVALAADVTKDSSLLTFVAGAGSASGRFVAGKYEGRGAARIRQTVTALIESGVTGTWLLATDGKTLTVADTTGLAAGDTVVLFSSEAEDATKKVAPGKYTIASITNGTVLVLAVSAVVATPAAAITCTGVAYTGNPVAQADLLDGEEIGGAEFVTAVNAGVVGLPYMVGGITYLCATDIAADADVTFAQGSFVGERKAFICLGTVATSDYTIDLATNGIQIDGSTALAEVNAIDAAGDSAFLVFHGARWFAYDIAGGATQA